MLFKAIILFGGALGLLYIANKLNFIQMTQAEAAQKLTEVANQLGKVRTEVQALVDAANNEQNISAELQAAIENVSAAVQGVDDINPDEVPETPEGEEPQA